MRYKIAGVENAGNENEAQHCTGENVGKVRYVIKLEQHKVQYIN